MSDTYLCAYCKRRHRSDSAIGKAHAWGDDTPIVPMVPTHCPVCGGFMLQYRSGAYCPAEDPHPGGLFIRLDGTVRHRSIIGASPTKESDEPSLSGGEPHP